MRQKDTPDKNKGGLIPQYLGVMPITQHMGLTQENLSSGLANNKGTDQPVPPRRLISAFVVRFLESIIPKLATGEISVF